MALGFVFVVWFLVLKWLHLVLQLNVAVDNENVTKFRCYVMKLVKT
jgi:hypothetical protein